MPTVKSVFLHNLAADFRALPSNKLINESIATGPAAPTAPPVEVGKTWLWLDTTTLIVSHYWNTATAAWIAFADPMAALKVLLTAANAGKAIAVNAAGTAFEAVPFPQEVFVGATPPIAADAWNGTKGFKFWIRPSSLPAYPVAIVFQWNSTTTAWEQI